MGADEALMASAVSLGRPALRFYRWQGPWLSVGYGQRVDGQRRLDCQRAGVGWVRRLTGGRAVLHGADLTYAIAAPEGVLDAGLAGAYAQVCRGLLQAVSSLGVSAEASDREARRPGRGGFDCFERPAPSEICVAGRKLCGSAQRRAGGAVLQHGSLRLRPDPVAAAAAAGIGGGATSLAEEGASPDLGSIVAACVEALGDALDATFEPSQLRPEELALAAARGLERPSSSIP
jgi:lipoate-protein ligase A